MTKNTKTLLTIAGVGVVGYIIYNKFIKKGSKNFSNFAEQEFSNYADEDFFNVGGGKVTGTKQTTLQTGVNIGSTGCEIVQGNVGYAGMPLSNNRIIVRTGNGTTLVCPRGQQYDMPR
jgi:hypothetical protein